MTDFFNEQPPSDFLLQQETPVVREGDRDRRRTIASLIAGPEVGQAVEQELILRGTSDIEEGLKAEALRRRQATVEQTVYDILLDQSLSAQERNSKIHERFVYMATMPPPSTLEIAQEKFAIEGDAHDENAERIQDSIAENYDSYEAAMAAARNAPAKFTFEGGTARQILDITAVGVVPGWSVNIREVINEAFPGFVPMKSILPWPFGGIGPDIKSFQEHVRSLPPEEAAAGVDRLSTAIENNRFLMSNNGYLKKDLMDTIINDLDDKNWEVALNNLIGALDWVGFGLIRGAGILGGKAIGKLTKPVGDSFTKAADEALANMTEQKPVGSIAKAADHVAPDDSKRMAEAILDDPTGAVARSFGTTREQVTAEHVLPKPLDADITSAPDLNNLQQSILDFDVNRALYTDGEFNTAVVQSDLRISDIVLRAMATVSPNVSMNKMGVQEIPGGYVAKYRIGDTQTRTFSSLKLAEDTALTFKEYDKSTARILVKDPTTAKWVKVDDILAVGKAVAPPPPAAGMTRMYHGSADHGRYDGPAWFSSDKDYAANYRDGAELQYTDFPTKLIDELKDPDGYGQTVARGFVLNKEFDVARKPYYSKGPEWFSPEKGQFMVEIDVVEMLNPLAALKNTEIFLPNSFVGKFAAWVDKSSVFQGWMVRAGNVAADLEIAKVKALNEVLVPMTKLKSNDQQKIIHVLDLGDRGVLQGDGSTKSKWFTQEELMDFWQLESNAAELVDGYMSVVRHQQMVRSMLNQRTRRLLDQEGYKHVILSKVDDGFSNLGRVVKLEQVPDIRRIYDASENKVIPFDDATKAKLTDSDQIIQLKSKAKSGKERFTYAILRNGEGASIRPLPAEVIKDIPGYIARIYDAPYIIKVATKGFVNGVEDNQLRAVRMYSTKGEMERDLKRLEMEANDDTKYIGTEARELREDIEYANRTSLEYLEDSGQLFTSHRGIEVLGVDGKRRLKSVADSIAAGRARAARAQTIDPLVDKLTANWEARYGKKYGVAGKMPWNLEDLQKQTQDLAELTDFDEAVALQRHIKLVAGVDDTMFTNVSRNMMIKVSDYLSTNYTHPMFQNTAEWLARNRNRSVVNGIKGAAFTHFIIFNPIRQLLLQSQQASVYLGVDHGLKYFFSGEGIRDYTALVHGAMFRNMDEWATHRKTGAKMLKMSESEYEHFVDSYIKTGMHASVDSHMYSMFSNLDRNVGTDSLWAKNWEYFNNFRRVARRFGFDAGERFQLTGAFLAARNKWIKENPKKSHLWSEDKNLLQIAGDARALAFNMNKTGTMQFQRGALGAAFQFLSHATKSTQVLIPSEIPLGKYMPQKLQQAYKDSFGRFANKAFSDAEKKRIIGIQFAMYGTGAFGINQMYEDRIADMGIEVPAEFNTAVQEGIAGSLLNLAFRAVDDASGVRSDLEFSTTIAPFSGIGGQQKIIGMGNPIGVLIDSLFLNPKEALELMGPGYQMLGKAGEAMKFTSTILGWTETGEMLPEVGLAVLDEWGRQMLPVYNNFVRARTADLYNRYVSATGNIGVEVSDGEVWAQGLLGTMPRRQRQVSEELIRLRGITGHPQKDRLTSALDETAEQYYKFAKRYVERLDETKENPMAALEFLSKQSAIFKEILDSQEHRYLFNKVRDLALNDLRAKSVETELGSMIMRLYHDSYPDLYDPAYMTKLKNFTPFNGQEEIINWIEGLKEWQTIE